MEDAVHKLIANDGKADRFQDIQLVNRVSGASDVREASGASEARGAGGVSEAREALTVGINGHTTFIACDGKADRLLGNQREQIVRNPYIVYVDGVFDLFHPGHIAFLKKARALGTFLLVGVVSDEDAAWKRPPIMTHAERIEMVRHCTVVDALIEHPPLVLTDKFLDEYGIELVVHGDDSRQEAFFKVPIERGIMRYVPYHQGVSTSGLIARVETRATRAPRVTREPRDTCE